MTNVHSVTDPVTERTRDSRSPNSVPLAILGTVVGLMAKDYLPSYDTLKARFRDQVERDPIDSLLFTVLGGGLVFYLTERDHNPRCGTYWDAVLYVATCLSVGYDDVFPKTRLGNMLASAVQTFGPSMAAAAFTPPASAAAGRTSATSAEVLAVNKAILARLDEIALILKPR
jgi:hypothetical protein